MHIPDGYLSLQTSIPAIGAMVPIWSIALNNIKKFLGHKQIPLLSLCAAFSFTIMMFNIPVGHSSVHAVGAVFIAILLGPWAACIAVSAALMIQAFVFGDGGILALGANCFNIAFIMPFSGYYVYRAIAGKSDVHSKRSMFGIFCGSYVGLNLAAFFTAVEFGIQPLLFTGADGNPLYGYYPLSVSIPAMMLEHTLIAGPIEGIVTMAAVAYLAKFAPQFLNRYQSTQTGSGKAFWTQYKPLLLGMAFLLVMVPLGLLAQGTAWGEWGQDELKEKIGYIPSGFARFSELWKSLLPDYSIPGLQNSFFQSSLGYVVSGLIGIVILFAVIFTTSKLMLKAGKGDGNIE